MSSPSSTPVMMNYATPAGADVRNRDAVVVQGPLIISGTTLSLPGRCVICDAPASRRLTRTLTWHHPTWALLVLVSVPIYIIVALCIRKRGTVHYSVCDTHVKARRFNLLIAWLIALAAIVVPILVAVLAEERIIDKDAGPYGLLAGVLLLVFALGFGLIKASWPLKPKYIDKLVMRVRGAGEPFLASLARETASGFDAQGVPIAMPVDPQRV